MVNIRKLLRKVLLFFTLLAGLGTVIGFWGRFGLLFELASNLRLQYLISLGCGALILAICKKPKLAVSASFLAFLNLILIVPFYQDPPLLPRETETRTYRALLLNVYWQNNAYENVWELIRVIRPDLIMLLEVTPAWEAALKDLHHDYPFVQSVPRDDSGGIAFLSRIPLEGDAIQDFGVETRPVIVAQVKVEGQPLTVIGLHPYASRVDWVKVDARQQQLEALTQFVTTRTEPVLVLADLNATPWSPLYQDLLRVSRLRDSRQGFGLSPTWPTIFPLLMMPIDHCLVSPEIVIVNYQTGPFIGSDHLPVIIDFSIRGNKS